MSKNIETNKTKEEKIFYPTNDYCFKRLFGYKGNEEITQGLIECILGYKCDVVEVTSDEVTEKDLASDKLGVLDVFVKQKDGTERTKANEWLRFIKNPNSIGGDVLEKNKALNKAKKEYEKIIADEHERGLIRLREKYMLDYNTLKEESYEDGVKQGLEQGIEQGKIKKQVEIAKKLLSRGQTIEEISDITGLTIKEIEKLK